MSLPEVFSQRGCVLLTYDWISFNHHIYPLEWSSDITNGPGPAVFLVGMAVLPCPLVIRGQGTPTHVLCPGTWAWPLALVNEMLVEVMHFTLAWKHVSSVFSSYRDLESIC